MKINDINFDGYVDFETIKEPWNIYSLEDESILRIRVLLLKVIQTSKTEDKKDYAVNTKTVMATYVQKELKGIPSIPNQKNKVEIEKKDIPFKVIAEDWNEYKLEDGTILKLKPVIARIDKLTLFDPYGDPLFGVASQILVKS